MRTRMDHPRGTNAFRAPVHSSRFSKHNTPLSLRVPDSSSCQPRRVSATNCKTTTQRRMDSWSICCTKTISYVAHWLRPPSQVSGRPSRWPSMSRSGGNWSATCSSVMMRRRYCGATVRCYNSNLRSGTQAVNMCALPGSAMPCFQKCGNLFLGKFTGRRMCEQRILERMSCKRKS